MSICLEAEEIMSQYIGSVIKKIRTNKGLTQKELASGLCSIKQINRIENNFSTPNSYLLYEISNRLGHELLDFIPYTSDENAYDLKTKIDDLMLLFNLHEHKSILNNIYKSQILQNTENTRASQEISWLLGAMSNYIDIGESVIVDEQYYMNILKLKHNFTILDDIFQFHLTPIEFKIINSYIVILLNNHCYDRAEKLLLKSIENFESNNLNNSDISYVRFLYNLSRLYYNQKRFYDAIELSSKGINHCHHNSNISYLADLYNIYGRAKYNIGDQDTGKQAIKNYISLRRIIKPPLDYEPVITELEKKYHLSEE